MSIPPAWHPDPTGRHDHRWWDGTQWTDHVADAGVASVDSVAVAEGTDRPADESERTTELHHSPGQSSAPDGATAWAGQPAAGAVSTGATQASTSGLAVTAMILGILAVAFAWVPFLGILAAVGGVVAIVLGGVGMAQTKQGGRRGRGMAITGLVTGIVSVVLAIAVHVAIFQGLPQLQEMLGDFDRCVEITGDEESCRQMSEMFGDGAPSGTV